MRTNDGMTLRGSTAAQLVAELHKTSLTPSADDAEFMAKTAQRARDQTGRPVRHDTMENFIADLVDAGLLVEGEK